ncbi:hypothetical protein GGF38_003531, partial [Coemansia sp. RSA 25]
MTTAPSPTPLPRMSQSAMEEICKRNLHPSPPTCTISFNFAKQYAACLYLHPHCQCRTLEERECRRRLVQFWRRHESNNIFCTFKAVPAADRVPNSIVVSCIYWEEKQDFFVTSVDCIHLLESLIAVRFTVEEKNRIRRNLEGFRPLTVSKCKPDSADFFKLIMSFPNPKPRNIEKDVKVFPWRILPMALKKIIGKYTASYSSTASITLDAHSASRASSFTQLADGPLCAAGGMATFSPCQTSASMLGGSSASAAI